MAALAVWRRSLAPLAFRAPANAGHIVCILRLGLSEEPPFLWARKTNTPRARARPASVIDDRAPKEWLSGSRMLSGSAVVGDGRTPFGIEIGRRAGFGQVSEQRRLFSQTDANLSPL